mgnify:CR=1 FL=1
MERGDRPIATSEQFRHVRDAFREIREHTVEVDAIKPDKAEEPSRPKVMLGSIVEVEYPDRQRTVRIILVDSKAEYKGDKDLVPIEMEFALARAVVGREASDDLIDLSGKEIRIISVTNPAGSE